MRRCRVATLMEMLTAPPTAVLPAKSVSHTPYPKRALASQRPKKGMLGAGRKTNVPNPMPTPRPTKISTQANTMLAMARLRSLARPPPQHSFPATVFDAAIAAANDAVEEVTLSQKYPCTMRRMEETQQKLQKKQRMARPAMMGANTRTAALTASGTVLKLATKLELGGIEAIELNSRGEKGGGGGGGGGGDGGGGGGGG